jgi:hypothetical protein
MWTKVKSVLIIMLLFVAAFTLIAPITTFQMVTTFIQWLEVL